MQEAGACGLRGLIFSALEAAEGGEERGSPEASMHGPHTLHNPAPPTAIVHLGFCSCGQPAEMLPWAPGQRSNLQKHDSLGIPVAKLLQVWQKTGWPYRMNSRQCHLDSQRDFGARSDAEGKSPWLFITIPRCCPQNIGKGNAHINSQKTLIGLPWWCSG